MSYAENIAMADITKLTDYERVVVDEYHRLYYPFFRDTKWLGVTARKCPFDLFVYQELIFELRPDLIIECGTADGGSAVFLASICELAGHGEVVTIDIRGLDVPKCHRVSYWQGGTLSTDVLTRLESFVQGMESVMVILDDDHTRDHVLEELRTYQRFVTPGSYLIVEDTNINNHPVFPEFGPGPMEAVETFLGESCEFKVDHSCEKFFLSFNPSGFLRKSGTNRCFPGGTESGFLDPERAKELALQGQKIKSLEAQLEHETATLHSVLDSKGWKWLNRLRDARAWAKQIIPW
jgi:cephalosporin hydroxylase